MFLIVLDFLNIVIGMFLCVNKYLVEIFVGFLFIIVVLGVFFFGCGFFSVVNNLL